MGAYLNRAAILAAHDLPTEDVHVPEWADPETGADLVCVRGLTGEGRDEFEASTTVMRGSTAVQDSANIRAKLAARCIIDPASGEPLFTQQDVYELGKLSGAALNRVFQAAARLSGMGPQAEIEGNSPAAPGGGSPTS